MQPVLRKVVIVGVVSKVIKVCTVNKTTKLQEKL